MSAHKKSITAKYVIIVFIVSLLVWAEFFLFRNVKQPFAGLFIKALALSITTTLFILYLWRPIIRWFLKHFSKDFRYHEGHRRRR